MSASNPRSSFKGHTHTELRTHSRINIRVTSSLTVTRVPAIPITLTVPISLRVPSSLTVTKVPPIPITLTVPISLRASYFSHSIQKSDSSYSSHGPSLRYLYLKQRRSYWVWLYKSLEIHIFFMTLWLPVLYHNDYTYYPKRNTGIELLLSIMSIMPIVTGIYESNWCVFKRPRLPAIARKYSRHSANRISTAFGCNCGV